MDEPYFGSTGINDQYLRMDQMEFVEDSLCPKWAVVLVPVSTWIKFTEKLGYRYFRKWYIPVSCFTPDFFSVYLYHTLARRWRKFIPLWIFENQRINGSKTCFFLKAPTWKRFSENYWLNVGNVGNRISRIKCSPRISVPSPPHPTPTPHKCPIS